jgi:ABC-type multidrug transport system fused ATPase/permease subunit
LNSILKLISILSKQERRRLILIAVATLCVSIMGLVEVGSVAPFMAVATDPDIVNSQPQLAFLYRLGGFDSRSDNIVDFMIFLGIVIFTVIVIVTVFKLGISYISQRYIQNRRYTLGVRLFKQYLYQPYQFFLSRNTSELSKNILSEVDMVINGIMRPAIQIFINGVMAIAIFILLILLNPLMAIFTTSFFGLLYFGVYFFTRHLVDRRGKIAREFNRRRFKISAEAFGGIKDMKILGKESFFVDEFDSNAKRYVISQREAFFYSTIPGQFIHSMVVGFALAMFIILLAMNGSLVGILPLFSVYAFSTMRLIPNIRGIFSNLSTIRYNSHTIDALYSDITTLILPADLIAKEAAGVKVMPFTRKIELRGIEFSYPSSREPVLKSINLTIAKNTAIAFEGMTGCGKTTLVDVIMGLLAPSGGSVNVDGVPVLKPFDGRDNRAAIAPWQRNFGYVPQQIYLSDQSVAANIAYGIPEILRNAAAIEKAARIANLHDFIVDELPDGYDTLIGERGIRLSGGQRQRVGIARALYHDPDILVMDEATSALDSITEDAVMDAINNLMRTKTIIIIAHRLTTIQECDTIYCMEQGRITASGTYGELLETSPQFRALAKVKDNRKI